MNDNQCSSNGGSPLVRRRRAKLATRQDKWDDHTMLAERWKDTLMVNTATASQAVVSNNGKTRRRSR